MANQAESKSKHNAAHEEDTSKNASAAQKNGDQTKSESGDLSQQLDSLKSTLSGDLSKVSSEDALNLIDQWYDSLHKAKQPEVKEIATHLKQLKQLLKGGKATGHEISEVLVEIGDQTANIAAEADKETKTPIRDLGKQITKVGNSLGKAEDQQEIEEIDSLVETLDGDLTKIKAETAVGAVDNWYNLLHKSEDKNLAEIANGLKELKQLLKHNNSKPADISNVLEKLGEQTVAAAHEAKRGFKGPIQRLGKLLSKAGKSVEG